MEANGLHHSREVERRKMNTKKHGQLLQIVKSGRSIEALKRSGLTTLQIFNLISECLETGWIKYNDSGRLELTNDGSRELSSCRWLQGRSRDGWIATMDSERIERLDKSDIYIPRYKTSRKLLDD